LPFFLLCVVRSRGGGGGGGGGGRLRGVGWIEEVGGVCVWVGVYIALRHVVLWYYIYSQSLVVVVVLVVLVALVVEELEIHRVSLRVGVGAV
jgi:hypothetical protein